MQNSGGLVWKPRSGPDYSRTAAGVRRVPNCRTGCRIRILLPEGQNCGCCLRISKMLQGVPYAAISLDAGVGRRARPCAGANRLHPLLHGKNQIRYDNFDWHTYQTEHFEIYYYPEIEPHLERIAGYAEAHPQRQLGLKPRSLDEAAADPVLDGERVLAAERDSRRRAGRRRRVRRAGPLLPHHACRSTSRPICSIA